MTIEDASRDLIGSIRQILLRAAGGTLVVAVVASTIVPPVLSAQGPVDNASRIPDSKGAPVIRKLPPTGNEIAGAARNGVLDHTNTATATVLGKPFKFTPVQLPQNGSKPTGGIGFAGVLENGAEGDETGLPPGRYNIFVTNVEGQWKGYAESGGRIVREAIRVSDGTLPRGAKPQFMEKGWCVVTHTLWTDGWYVYYTSRKICF